MELINRLTGFILIVIIICSIHSCRARTSDEYIEEGIEYTKAQKYKKATASFKKAIDVDPENPLAHYSLGGIYTFMDMNEMAISEFKRAVEIDPTYPDPHYSLGFVYEKMGRDEESKREFRLFELLR